MNRSPLVSLSVVALCALLLVGCDAKKQETKITANPWVATQILTSEGHKAVLTGTSPAIYFRSDGTVIGNASINTFRGPYTLKGRDIHIGPLAATEWAGPQMESAQDQLVLDALASSSRYVVQKGVLQLSDPAGELLMSLQVAPAPKLVGPNWICTQIVTETGTLASVVGSAPASAAFAQDGALAGSSGVNQYSTKYAISGPQMTIAPEITSTKMAGPDAQMAQETRYLDALSRTATYKIEDYQLSLIDKFGIVSVVYIPGAPKF